MKISFDKDNYKDVERFNGRVTVVTLTGTLKLTKELEHFIYSRKTVDWVGSHTNPTIQYYTNALDIIAKGKAIRANDDADDPILAERIATHRAKIKMYYFVMKLVEKCINAYIKTLFGNVELMCAEFAQKDSLYDAYSKYKSLLCKENERLQKLLSK